MVDFNKLKELVNNNRLFIVIFISVIVTVAVAGMFLIPQEEPEPPVEKPYVEGMSYDYTTVTFSYGYSGPENPEEKDVIYPERVILHTTDEITKETRLHEFNPTYMGDAEQSYTVDLKELAEDPDDHLRTHPEINLTVIYSNGARQTAVSTIGPDNLTDILYTNYRVDQLENGSVRLTFNKISAQQIAVETPNKTYTVTEDGSQVTVSPEDYYIDADNDGVYESKGSVKVKKQYHDVSDTIRTLEPSFEQPDIRTRDGNREGHFVLEIESMEDYDSYLVKTPGGKYIEEETYNPKTGEYEGDENTYLQTAEGVGETRSRIMSIKDEAQVVEIYTEINGKTYIIHSIGINTNSDNS